MGKPTHLARTLACCCLAGWVLACAASAWAEPCAEHPCQHGGLCIPNAKDFGYFQTQWRLWPGEPRPDIHFPQSVGAEVLPAPEGHEQVPLPKAIPVPQDQGFDLPVPGEPILPPEGGSLLEPALPGGPDALSPLVPGLPGGIDPLPGGSLLEPPAEEPTPTVPSVPGNGSSSDPFAPSASDPLTPAPLQPGGGTTPSPLLPPANEPSAVNPFGMADPPRLTPRLAAAGPIVRPESGASESAAGKAASSMPEPIAVAPNSTPKPPEPVPTPPKATAISAKAGPALVEPVPSEPASLPATAETSPKLPEPAPGETGPALTTPGPSPMPTESAIKKPEPPKANWMAALHPGFRGDAGRTGAVYPASQAAQPVAHQVAMTSQAEPSPSAQEPKLVQPQRAQPEPQPVEAAVGAARTDSPPVALDGFCPVALIQSETWEPGDPRWTAAYRGWTYLLSGPAQRQRFMAEPERYIPRFSGHDPVLAVDGGRHVAGHTDYCVTYDGRLYMFSSAVTLARFRKAPERYTDADTE